MEIKLYQVLVALMGAFFVLRSILRFRNGQNSLAILTMWIVTGLAISAIAIFPDQISLPVAKWLGIESNVNAVLFLGLGALLVNNYILSQKTHKLEEQLKALARQYAKDNARSPKKE